MSPLRYCLHRNSLRFSTTLIYLALLVSCSGNRAVVVTPTITTAPKSSATNTTTAAIQTVTEEPKHAYGYKVTLLSNHDPSHDVLSLEGKIDLDNKLAFFDFDKGERSTTASADIYLFVGCGSDCFNTVIAINDATSVHWFVGTELGYAGCRNALQGETNIYAVNIREGEYSCLLTNEGNFVQIVAIENEASSIDSEFVFGYTIWFTTLNP